MARRKKKLSRPRKDTFAIIVDGNTEVWYFQMFKRNEPHLQINIEPKIPQKKKISEQYEKVLQLANEFTKVFWIIDLDVIIRESRKTKTGNKTKLQELKKYLKQLEKEKFKNVITILNNPCLEYWFILHFEQITKYFAKCLKAERRLKNHLNDYNKSREYFTKENNDIYLKLKPMLPKAIQNARKTQREKLNEIERGICEMNLFFESEELKSIIKQTILNTSNM